MTGTPLATTHRHLGAAMTEPSAVTAGASDGELLSVLTMCEGLARQLDRLTVTMVATLERRGTFAEHGYRSTAAARIDPERRPRRRPLPHLLGMTVDRCDSVSPDIAGP